MLLLVFPQGSPAQLSWEKFVLIGGFTTTRELGKQPSFPCQGHGFPKQDIQACDEGRRAIERCDSPLLGSVRHLQKLRQLLFSQKQRAGLSVEIRQLRRTMLFDLYYSFSFDTISAIRAIFLGKFSCVTSIERGSGLMMR